MFLPKSPPLMSEFLSLHPLCSLFGPHNPPQNAPNFTGLRLPLDLSHLNSLLLCGFLFSPHPLLLHNPHLPPPRLLHRPIDRCPGLVHQRKIEPFAAEIGARPERGKGTGEIGMRDLDGHVCDAIWRVDNDLRVVHSCWVREYEGLEAEREVSAKKRSRRIARVQEESMANAAKIAEVKAKELDEKVKNKYGQWVKTDFEG
ncbi:putative membrane lipoprotein [Actinidia rufa]|uniref:Putative membrane lipoprotein n=1 Tax=Actinidia rufa TaxID=165716 RepID=A0A7J0DEU2_9ERIC|nr:putative membrane lipoprotein [Actinidia rufa]